MPHGLFLTRRQETKIRNDFTNNILTDMKRSEAQFSKIIQSGGFLDRTLGNMMGKKTLIDLAVPLAKDILPKLATKVASSAIDKFERK